MDVTSFSHPTELTRDEQDVLKSAWRNLQRDEFQIVQSIAKSRSTLAQSLGVSFTELEELKACQRAIGEKEALMAKALMRTTDMLASRWHHVLEDAQRTQQEAMRRMASQWRETNTTSLFASIQKSNEKFLKELRDSVSLKNVFAEQNKLLTDSLAAYKDGLRQQMAASLHEIENLQGGKAIKEILQKVSIPERSAVNDDRERSAANEPVIDERPTVASFEIGFQSLTGAVRELDKLALLSEEKDDAVGKANALAAKSLLVAYLALYTTIFLGIFAPYWDFYVKECIGKGEMSCKSYREALGAERKSSPEELAFNFYRSTRRIVSRAMAVHLNSKALSPEVARLRPGDLVVVLREGSDWTLVEVDTAGLKKAGWVYTRYLNKL